VSPVQLERKIPKDKERAAVLATMLEVGLFDLIPAGEQRVAADSDDVWVELGPFPEDRYAVHDFLERHDSRRQVLDRRRKDSARKTRGVRRDSERIPRGFQAESAGIPDDSLAGAPATRPDPTRPDPVPPCSPPRGGRQKDRVKWEESALRWARSLGYTADDMTLLRAIRQAEPWAQNGGAAEHFAEFVAVHFGGVA
jgi:hypothetical protein